MDLALADQLQGLLAVVGGEEAIVLPGEIDLQGLHDVPVVEIDAQLPAHDLGNGPPLAGKLPGKGNHKMLHAAASCFFLILGFCNLRTAQDRAKLITK